MINLFSIYSLFWLKRSYRRHLFCSPENKNRSILFSVTCEFKAAKDLKKELNNVYIATITANDGKITTVQTLGITLTSKDNNSKITSYIAVIYICYWYQFCLCCYDFFLLDLGNATSCW
jgi:hypothetical protein